MCSRFLKYNECNVTDYAIQKQLMDFVPFYNMKELLTWYYNENKIRAIINRDKDHLVTVYFVLDFKYTSH